jgi:DNA primase
MKQKGMTFWDALTKLAAAVGMTLPVAERSGPVDREAATLRNGLYTVLQQAASLYAYGLAQHADAQAYLAARGISAETAKAFGVGYVRSGIRNVLAKRVKDPAWIVTAGIVSAPEPSREVELLRHRVTVALRNERGMVVGFSGRLIDGVGAGPKYLNSPETPIFHKSRELFGLDLARSEIIKRRSAVLVEGYFDVMGLHQFGERRAVAAMGTALSTEQAVRLLRDVDVLFLCLDGDKAGKAATIRTAKVLLKQLRDGQEIRLVRLPNDQDPDEFIRGEGIDAWHTLLDRSQRLSDFLIEDLSGGDGELSPETMVSAALAAREWLSQCENCPLFAQALRVSLQRRLGIEV